MEMNTQTKSFLLFLTPCLAFLICQLPFYLFAFSQPWQEVLPAPPANSVMIVGVNRRQPVGPSPNLVRTKDSKYYQLIGSSINDKEWVQIKTSENINNSFRKDDYEIIIPIIPFLFNPPPGTVIDHFYTEHIRIESTWPRYRKYYVLLDGGTLWSWSEPLALDEHNILNKYGVFYAVIVFIVTGVMLLVIKRVGRPLPFRKPYQLLLLIFISLTIGFILAVLFLLFYSYLEHSNLI